MLRYYLSGAEPILKTFWLACIGREITRPSNGESNTPAVPLLTPEEIRTSQIE